MLGHERGAAVVKLIYVAVLAACALAPLTRPALADAAHTGGEPPMLWSGRPLRPLALGEVEQRFARRFPGRIARLTDGEQVLVWREVRAPTRMLHPAADCYRGLGYRIDEARLEHDEQDQLWRCFVAERQGRRVRVCERIVDADGQAYTDASSWFWAAQLQRSTGPWQAITVARPL
jgi:hypothetical protein